MRNEDYYVAVSTLIVQAINLGLVINGTSWVIITPVVQMGIGQIYKAKFIDNYWNYRLYGHDNYTQRALHDEHMMNLN